MNSHLVYLAQTETTVGFLSQNATALIQTKQRPETKPFIISVDSCSTLKTFTHVPLKYRSRIRRARKTTFAYPNGQAIRVVKDEAHLSFLQKLTWSYSTSSNPSGKPFDENFALEKANVIVFTCKGLFEATPSSILKLGKSKLKKVR